MKVACLEEIAFRKKWLTADDIAVQAEKLKKTSYGQYLAMLIKE
jgi:glucose-1-phosphate thymidylyltransferase